MKASKIKIHNLFGIEDRTLDGKSVELSGPKGCGKTSVLDAIRFALTNRSDRDYIIRQGADEGEILIETDTGVSIERWRREQKADKVRVKEGNMLQTRAAEYLNGIFTPLQLNPVEFTQLPRQEKNRVILSLIDFKWDLKWIAEQFGEIPQKVDYSKHILEVLSDIQSENGVYYQSRQNINRDIRNKQGMIADIAKDIPDDYDAERWEKYPITEKYQEIAAAKDRNGKIQRAQDFAAAREDKLRGIQGKYEIAVSSARQTADERKGQIAAEIERLKGEIAALEQERAGLKASFEQETRVAKADMEAATAKLDADMGVAAKYANLEPVDISVLQEEVELAESMRLHLNEYQRMKRMQEEVEQLAEASKALTEKIERARELPGEILKEAKLPIEGLSVEDGVPLIHGLPISNLSDGELLSLCVDITIARPGALGIILVDGAERLDEKSRAALYQKCLDAGLQLIATRTSDSDELEIVELN